MTSQTHIRRPLLSISLGFLLVHLNCLSQGTFQNLDFEAAVIIPVPGDMYGRVQFAPAFPGWIGSNGGNMETLALYNNMFLDSTGLGIQGPGTTFPRIDGNYTAMIQSGFALSGPPTRSIASLSQTALVPVGTASLRFKAIADGPFQVSLNDSSLSVTPVQVVGGYTTLYGVNIPTYAGTTAKLTFTAIHGGMYGSGISSLFIDAIQFSNQPIPEPSAFGLFGLGALLLIRRLRRG